MVELIQPSLDRIVEWGRDSGLAFNSSKTVAVFFTNKNTKISSYPKIKINNIPTKYSVEATNLGITMDSRLTWNNHIRTKIAKAKLSYVRNQKLYK